MMVRHIFTLCLILTGLITASIANAITIDFESAPTAGCQVTQGGSIDGFTLGAVDFGRGTGGGFNNGTDCSFIAPTANSGQNYMLNFNSFIAEFTKDVGSFDLVSLFVHADIRSGNTSVKFEGLDGVGGNVLFSANVNIVASWQQIVFTGWNGVKTFTWDSLVPASSNIAIDDFEYQVASVPEPGTLGLVGAGLFGLSFIRRKRTLSTR